jgi:hypothetical protein
MALNLIPPNVIDYKIVQGNSVEEFESLMLQFLSEGFIPYGELNITRTNSNSAEHPLYNQVVIRQGLPNTETLNIIAKMAKAQQETGMGSVNPQFANLIAQFAAKSAR